jgi:bifunctional DNase/RNase
MLKDKAAERYLPIYIGKLQASKIKDLLIRTPTPEPQELGFLDNTPGDLKLNSIVINKVEDYEFYTKLRLKSGDKTKHSRVQLTEAIIASIRK